MSEQAKHTPGPWAVHPISARVDAFVGGTPLPVCELLWPTDERSEAETEANARLIAAAPNLLAALRCADQFITNGIELGYIRMPDPDCPDTAKDTPGIVRAALAAAKGAA